MLLLRVSDMDLGGFWDGFEKRAASLLGSMPGISSGLRRFSQGGRVHMARPVSGQVIGPRATPTRIPGPVPQKPMANVTGSTLPGTKVHQPKIKKPAKQYGRGVSTTNI